jgi:hypothetical protein
MKKILMGLSAVATALMHNPEVARACAVCLTGDSGPMGDAYNWSILFLMATPYTVMGCVGAWLVYKYRRGKALQQRVEREQPLAQLALHYKESGR